MLRQNGAESCDRSKGRDVYTTSIFAGSERNARGERWNELNKRNQYQSRSGVTVLFSSPRIMRSAHLIPSENLLGCVAALLPLLIGFEYH